MARPLIQIIPRLQPQGGEPSSHPPVSGTDEELPQTADFDVDLLFRQYAPYVAAVALRLLGRDDELEDLVHDVFVVALKDLKQVRNPLAIKGWLATLAVHAASKRLRRRRLRSFLGLDCVPDYENLVAPGATAEERMVLAQVYTVLDDLPTAQRIAWVLRYVQGEQLDDVAQLCDCSLATAKRRIAFVNETLERTFTDA